MSLCRYCLSAEATYVIVSYTDRRHENATLATDAPDILLSADPVTYIKPTPYYCHPCAEVRVTQGMR